MHPCPTALFHVGVQATQSPFSLTLGLLASSEPSHSPEFPLHMFTCAPIHSMKQAGGMGGSHESMPGGGEWEWLLGFPHPNMPSQDQHQAQVGTNSRCRGHHPWGHPLCSSQNLLVGTGLGSWDSTASLGPLQGPQVSPRRCWPVPWRVWPQHCTLLPLHGTRTWLQSGWMALWHL